MDLHSTRNSSRPITGPLLDALLRKQVSDTSQHLSNLRVKQGGFGLPNLRTTATDQYSTSKKSTDHLINAIKGREVFNSQVHQCWTVKAKKEHQVRTVENEKKRYSELVENLREPQKRILERASQTGIWLSQYPSTYNGNILSPEEFRDSATHQIRRNSSQSSTSLWWMRKNIKLGPPLYVQNRRINSSRPWWAERRASTTSMSNFHAECSSDQTTDPK